jgi:putative alpha-1,2-mannosidase
VAYLFNEAGRPDLAQKWVRWVLEHKYGTGYDGLDGRILRIVAENYTPENFYVERVRLNNAILDRTFIRHSEMAGGGVLSFEMSNAPCVFE